MKWVPNTFLTLVLTVVRAKFYILLTVHLDVILVNDQLDTLFLSVFISCLYMPPPDWHVEQSPTRVCYTR
jgi:hypothetical protein